MSEHDLTNVPPAVREAARDTIGSAVAEGTRLAGPIGPELLASARFRHELLCNEDAHVEFGTSQTTSF